MLVGVLVFVLGIAVGAVGPLHLLEMWWGLWPCVPTALEGPAANKPTKGEDNHDLADLMAEPEADPPSSHEDTVDEPGRLLLYPAELSGWSRGRAGA